MTTDLFLVAPVAGGSIHISDQWTNGDQYTRRNGSIGLWHHYPCSAARGSGIATLTAPSVAGTTSGFELVSNGQPILFISPPIDQDVTIAGTITYNFWGLESSMNANAGIGCRVLKIDHATGVISVIAEPAPTLELGTSSAVNNYTGSPTSTDMVKGDRFALAPFFDDAGGTMASGFTLTFQFSAASAGVSGDSWVRFAETFGFITTDSNVQTLHASNSAASGAINPTANTEKQLAFSNPASSATAVTATTAGPTAPRQMTATSGGTALEWYSDELAATTLSGVIVFNSSSMLESNASANATVITEVAICDQDGLNCTVWGRGGGGTDGTLNYIELNTAADLVTHYIMGPDTAIPARGRLRLIVYQDDAYGRDVAGPMGTGFTTTMAFGNNNTQLILGQTLSAYVAPADPPFKNKQMQQLLPQ